MSYIDATYLENADDFVIALNENDLGMDEAVDFVRVHGDDDEPEWFDFEDYYETTPIAGFVDGKAIMVSNVNDPDRESDWISAGPDNKDLSTWKK